MILTDDTVQHLGDGMIVSFPVLAVAYFAARGGTDRSEASTARPVVIPVPAQWRAGPRGFLVSVFQRIRDDEGNLLFDSYVRLGFDRSMLLALTAGMTAATAARVFTAYGQVTRALTGLSVAVFILALNTILVFTTQMVAVRDLADLSELRTPPAGGDDPGRAKMKARLLAADVHRPFRVLRLMTGLAALFVACGISLAVLIIISRDPAAAA
jgi:hypothetical protein